MTIKAGGRVALIAATGLLVCAVGASWTVTTSDAAETNSENVGTSKQVKQVRYYKRYAGDQSSEHICRVHDLGEAHAAEKYDWDKRRAKELARLISAKACASMGL